MKLLLCTKCSDVFSLKVKKVRTCSCGEIAGEYTDNYNARYWGAYAIPIGFANSSLVDTIKEQSALGNRPDLLGRRFEAFIIPDDCDSFVHVK